MTRGALRERGAGVTRRPRFSRGQAAVAMVCAGPLWVAHGVLTMLRPWGDDVVYDAAVGYSLVREPVLFLLYSAPGSLALVLSAAGTVGMLGHVAAPGRGTSVARALGVAALLAGLASLAGVVALVDPVFTAGRILGTVLLATGLLVAAGAVRRGAGSAGWSTPLAVVGVLGELLLPLWPLVYALRWLSEAAGALVIALFGLGWVWLGWRLRRS